MVIDNLKEKLFVLVELSHRLDDHPEVTDVEQVARVHRHEQLLLQVVNHQDVPQHVTL